MKKLLIVTSLLFLIPFYISKMRNEIIISILLFINTICSVFFWYDPIQHSMIHRIDAIFARISILFFTMYMLFYKKTEIIMKNMYLSILINGIIMFYFSDFYSNIEWCSNDHIKYHFIFHIFIIIGSTVVVL